MVGFRRAVRAGRAPPRCPGRLQGEANAGGNRPLQVGCGRELDGTRDLAGVWERNVLPTKGTVMGRKCQLQLRVQLSKASVWDTGWGCLGKEEGAVFLGGGLGSGPTRRK